MGILLGIDLGTSSIRVLATDTEGHRLGVVGKQIGVCTPATGAAEQDPQVWWDVLESAVRELMGKTAVDPQSVQSIGFSGQMHGLVCVDSNGDAIRPAMIWQDQRSAPIVRRTTRELGTEFLLRNTQNLLSPGFLGMSLAWLRENEPDNYRRIDKVMLPKDYLKYRLSGQICTDYSDAAGTGIFDNATRDWSQPLLDYLQIPREILPSILPSHQVVGHLHPAVGERLNLSPMIPIANGGADQCMQGIGNGIVAVGDFSVNVGTGGQIATIVSEPTVDALGRTNTFAHVIPDRWNLMGATLSAGASLKWFAHRIAGTTDFAELDALAAQTEPGAEGLLFLPYLGGERTPIMDPDASGVFFGLTARHHSGHLARAIMEGVAFSLRNCLRVVEGDLGQECQRMVVSGGGAKSPLWRQILADILETPLIQSKESEQASLGAAANAGVAAEVYEDYDNAVHALTALEATVTYPRDEVAETYREQCALFTSVYSDNVATFGALRRIARPVSSREE